MVDSTISDVVKQPVLEMYMQHPYPNYSAEERNNIFAAELTRYKFLGLDEFLPNARVLDVGCGTTHRVMPIVQHFGVKEYVGIDHSTASLEVGWQLAAELGFTSQAKLIEGDIFNLPFGDNSFDVVISQGVLHHTSNPFLGFQELVRVCKPLGFVDIYLYNLFNHWRHNQQKAKVNRLAGDDINKRFEVAHRLYGEKPIAEMTPHEIAGFFDQYCHPHKSDHTIGETLEWFEKEHLDYWGAYPALRFRDFAAMLQFRGSLLDRYPHIHTSLTKLLVKACMFLPSFSVREPPFKAPTAVHRFFWQVAYALQGARGRYSGGPAFCARKRA